MLLSATVALWFSVTDSGWERMEEEDYGEEDDDKYVKTTT